MEILSTTLCLLAMFCEQKSGLDSCFLAVGKGSSSKRFLEEVFFLATMGASSSKEVFLVPDVNDASKSLTSRSLASCSFSNSLLSRSTILCSVPAPCKPNRGELRYQWQSYQLPLTCGRRLRSASAPGSVPQWSRCSAGPGDKSPYSPSTSARTW